MSTISHFSRCLLPAALWAASGIALADSTLAERGISVLGSYTGEAAGAVSGGNGTGGGYAGQIFFGSDVDFSKFAGWDGAKLRVYFASRHGNNVAQARIGNSTSIQEIFGSQTTRLANFTLEQKLFDGRLDLEAGRTVANIHFLDSQLCNYFQTNSACGNPTFVFRTSGFTYWPVSSWGGDARAWLTPSLYLHAGVFEVNPRRAVDSDHGFEWGLGGATGVNVPVAIGYKTDAAHDRLPRLYELGGWYDSSTYSDPRDDANGVPAVLSGLPYDERRGRSGLFARFEQQLTRPDPGSDRGFVLFGAALLGTSGALVEDHFFELGFVQKGTFPGREHDSLAFVVTQQHYSDRAIENLSLARAAAGGGDPLHHQQTIMELSYGIEVSPWLRIAPNLHYIIDPDSLNAPTRRRNLPNAFAVGMRIDIGLSPWLQAGAERLARY